MPERAILSSYDSATERWLRGKQPTNADLRLCKRKPNWIYGSGSLRMGFGKLRRNRVNPIVITHKENQMSKQDEAGLILQLYDLRREEVMRTARNWYFAEFNPESMAEFNK